MLLLLAALVTAAAAHAPVTVTVVRQCEAVGMPELGLELAGPSGELPVVEIGTFVGGLPGRPVHQLRRTDWSVTLFTYGPLRAGTHTHRHTLSPAVSHLSCCGQWRQYWRQWPPLWVGFCLCGSGGRRNVVPL